jgi:hypothetical protein
MSKNFTVHHGRTYRAKLKLSFFEAFASNDQVAEKFQELGFTDITISGQGDHRWAQGVWGGPDESVPLTDEHIESVIEVKAPKAAMESPSVYRRPLPGDVGEQGGITGDHPPMIEHGGIVGPLGDPVPGDEDPIPQPIDESGALGFPVGGGPHKGIVEGDDIGHHPGDQKMPSRKQKMGEGMSKEEWDKLHEDGG